MKATSKFKPVVVLELTVEEARWLKGVMQNPLWGDSPEEESIEDNNMRRKFFDAILWEGVWV